MSNSHPFKFVQLSSVFQWSIELKRIAFQRYSHIEIKFIQSISPSIILYIEVRHCILNFAHWKENISIRYYSSIGNHIKVNRSHYDIYILKNNLTLPRYNCKRTVCYLVLQNLHGKAYLNIVCKKKTYWRLTPSFG